MANEDEKKRERRRAQQGALTPPKQSTLPKTNLPETPSLFKTQLPKPKGLGFVDVPDINPYVTTSEPSTASPSAGLPKPKGFGFVEPALTNLPKTDLPPPNYSPITSAFKAALDPLGSGIDELTVPSAQGATVTTPEVTSQSSGSRLRRGVSVTNQEPFALRLGKGVRGAGQRLYQDSPSPLAASRALDNLVLGGVADFYEGLLGPATLPRTRTGTQATPPPSAAAPKQEGSQLYGPITEPQRFERTGDFRDIEVIRGSTRSTSRYDRATGERYEFLTRLGDNRQGRIAQGIYDMIRDMPAGSAKDATMQKFLGTTVPEMEAGRISAEKAAADARKEVLKAAIPKYSLVDFDKNVTEDALGNQWIIMVNEKGNETVRVPVDEKSQRANFADKESAINTLAGSGQLTEEQIAALDDMTLDEINEMTGKMFQRIAKE